MVYNMRAGLVGLVGAAGLANAHWGNTTHTEEVVYTTETVTALTTYCPGPTTLTHQGSTITVTASTTLTLPCDGGCEVTVPCTTIPAEPTTTVPAGNGTQYTTEVVTAITTFCPAATSITHGGSTIVVTAPTTITLPCPGGCEVTHPVTSEAPAPTSSVSPEDCPAECSTSYYACRVGPNANQAQCAAEYAGCLGYNPFGEDGSFVTPTACSSQAAPSTLVSMTGSAPATVPTVVPAQDCPAECYDTYNMCRSSPDANMSLCASNFSICLGYSPFGDDGSLIVPTACSAGATGPSTTMPAGATGPATTMPAGTPAATPGVIPGSGAAGLSIPAGLVVLGAIALL